jgi:protein required for attachment to host cells
LPKHQKLLIVVADGEHARFIRSGPGHALHTETSIDSLSAHKRSAELKTDHPGASFHTGSSAHHALAPRHDPHALEKKRFAHLIADQLNAGAARSEFGELLIAAPAHTLVEIRGELDTETAAKIVGTIAKDLVKTPDHELWPHVRGWVRPGSRTAG